MKDLLEIREEIDAIDDQIVKLYEERMELAEEVAEYKILNHKTLFSTKPFNNDNFIVVLYFGKIVNYRLLLMKWFSRKSKIIEKKPHSW